MLYAYSEVKFKHAYERMSTMPQFASITFKQETHFESDLRGLILKHTQTPFLCFHVDDMVFFRELEIDPILDVLESAGNKLFAFFIKLHPGITYRYDIEIMARILYTF